MDHSARILFLARKLLGNKNVKIVCRTDWDRGGRSIVNTHANVKTKWRRWMRHTLKRPLMLLIALSKYFPGIALSISEQGTSSSS